MLSQVYLSNNMVNPVEVLNAAGFNGKEFGYSDSSLGSMRGPCPKCGGSRRLLIFVDNPVPNWNFYCDNCGYKGNRLTGVSSDLFGEQLNPDREKPDIERNLKDLNESTEWLDFHTSMTEENRAWLRERGIPNEYQDRWVLGYTPDKAYLFEKNLYRSPAYTIPKINHEQYVVNIDYRLSNPAPKAGKYRGVDGLPAAVFISSPGHTDLRRLFIVEGSFKAMVLCIFLESNGWGNSQVIGLPGVKSPLYKEHIYQYQEAFIMLDPDRPAVTKSVSRETGAQAVYLPVKIDDAIISGMSWTTFQSIISNSALL